MVFWGQSYASVSGGELAFWATEKYPGQAAGSAVEVERTQSAVQ